MKHIDEVKLEEDLEYRYQFIAEFLDFGPEDVAIIHGLAPQLLPKVAGIVEATYEKLLAYNATARHFVERGQGYEGPLPPSAEALTANHEQIRFRKEHLTTYLMSILGRPYDARMIRYLDTVGKMHTPKAGNRRINVPVVQMNAFMGKLSELLNDAILELGLERDQSLRAMKAIHKLLWLQNDFINRHYQQSPAGAK